MRRLRLFAAASAIALFASSSALAEEPTIASTGQAVVTLKDGGIYRGEVVELVPKDHVTLKLATGDIKRFAWKDVDRVDAPKAPEAPKAEEKPEPEAKPEPPPPPPKKPPKRAFVDADTPDTNNLRPRIHIETTTEHVSLFEYTGSGSLLVNDNGGLTVSEVDINNWRKICLAPCDVYVDPNNRYRIGGDGIQPSASFGVGDHVGDLRLKVSAGSSMARTAGLYLAMAGLGMGLIGGYEASRPDDPLQDTSSNHTIGAMLLIGGGIAIVTGAILFFANSTSVETEAGKSLVQKTPVPKVRLTAKGLAF